MQDTPNLKRKLKEYEKNISEARISGDVHGEVYWMRQLDIIRSRIALREKNRRNNKKQHKKAN